jgi:hypothetical protein
LFYGACGQYSLNPKKKSILVSFSFFYVINQKEMLMGATQVIEAWFHDTNLSLNR